MNNLPKLYFTMETYLFPMLEEELGELTAKMREFLRIVEVVRPSRFITSALRWCGLGRPMKDREKMLLAFFLKAVYDLPTTKVLIENLNTNPSLRRICGWEYRSEVHDLRHTFAVRTISHWYRIGKDVQSLLPALASYMGHEHYSNTAYYFTMTAELLGIAVDNFDSVWKSEVLNEED